MTGKLLILLVCAIVAHCNARSLESPDCQFNKFLLAYAGLCPIEQQAGKFLRIKSTCFVLVSRDETFFIHKKKLMFASICVLDLK